MNPICSISQPDFKTQLFNNTPEYESIPNQDCWFNHPQNIVRSYRDLWICFGKTPKIELNLIWNLQFKWIVGFSSLKLVASLQFSEDDSQKSVWSKVFSKKFLPNAVNHWVLSKKPPVDT